MFIKYLILGLLLNSCSQNELEYEYPVQQEIKTLKLQAKYNTIEKSMPIKNSKKETNKCEKTIQFMSINFDKINILSSSNNQCSIQAQKTINNVQYTFYALNTSENTQIKAFYKKNDSLIEEKTKSNEYSTELLNFLNL